ncbi:MAG: MFS transporter [Verrucomicrobia bacterium]|jgi:MFS family permease|nr:MFS transporter [Verrucomicrobiota bacterium]MBT7702398.1 MFS transporter [Verrucomicrobiota bacterium]
MIETTRTDPHAAWRYPAFRDLLIGRLVFLLGTQAQAMALAWEIYVRTNDPFALGLVALTKGIPMILFTLPGGVIADRFDRRRIMLICLAGATLTSLGLAWVSWVEGPLWGLFLLLFIDSSFMRLTTPAGASLMPLLLPRRLLENGVKWTSNVFQMTSLAGPALGGFILSWNLQATYLVCASTSIVFIILLLRMKVPPQERAERRHWVVEAFEGIRFVWSRKVLLGTVSLDLFAVLFGGAVYLLPVFARDILPPVFGMAPEQMLGWLNAAPAAGALSMGLIVAHLPPFRRAGRTMLLGVAGFGLVTIVFGFSTNFWLSWGMLFLAGASDNISVVVRHTLVNLVTPDAMRGRVSAVNSIFIGSSNELGGFESGLVARLFSPVVSVVSGGVMTLLVVATWARKFPHMRDFGNLAEASEENT